MDFLSNLTNTSVGNFFKGAVGNIGSFFSGTASKASGFLGVGDTYQGPKIPKSKGIDETFGISSYQGFKQSNPKLNTVGQRLFKPLPSARYTGGPEVGFSAFDKIKNSFFGKFAKAGYDAYTSGTDKRQAMIKAFPTAGKVSASGLDASSVTPGFGFASRATNRNAYQANQAAQAAIQAALANIKIQNAMLAQIKGTKPTITLNSVNNSINTRLSRRG